MSRIGKQPIRIPDGIDFSVLEGWARVKGPKGELKRALHPLVSLKETEPNIWNVSVLDPLDAKQRALWGLWKRLIENMVSGVNEGFSKKLEIQGVGYRANVQGKKLVLHVGFSHPVEFSFPETIVVSVDGNEILIAGVDKELVGETSARIRKIRPPEPYKGKGIRYVGEIIRRKAGKSAAKASS